MALTVEMVTFDTTDAHALAQWWARQVGGTVNGEPGAWFVVLSGPSGVRQLGFQRVEDPTPGKNRVHLDLQTPDVEAEIERLVADGATLVDRHTESGFSWVVLADPDGNRFCISQQH